MAALAAAAAAPARQDSKTNTQGGWNKETNNRTHRSAPPFCTLDYTHARAYDHDDGDDDGDESAE